MHFLLRSNEHILLQYKQTDFLSHSSSIKQKCSSLGRDTEHFLELEGQNGRNLSIYSENGFFKPALDFG